jgi:hypothetical protein
VKKYLILSLVCLGLSGSLWAGPVGFGFTSGIDFASQGPFQHPAGITYGTLTGYTGGLFADVSLFSIFSVQPEANFTMKGTHYVSEIAGTATTVNSDFNYLEFPLLIKGKVSLAPDLKAYLLAGPSFAVLLNEITTISMTSSAGVDDTRFFPATDWGLNSANPNYSPEVVTNGVFSAQLGHQIF